MQSEAYKLTGFTAVASAAGFLLRWLQNMQTLDAETGLSIPGKPITVVVAALIVLMAAGLFAVITYALKRCEAPLEPERALAGKTFIYKAVCILPAVLIAAAGVIMLVSSAWPERQSLVWRLCGATALAAAFGIVLVTVNLQETERGAACRIGMGLIILFGAMWLIAEYKTAAADPVVWRFAVEILAICAALMAFYYVAGYFFGEPSPRGAVFFCHMGAFLCVMSAVDEHTLAESIAYIAAALLLFTWGHVLVANMRRGEDPALAAAEPEKEI